MIDQTNSTPEQHLEYELEQEKEKKLNQWYAAQQALVKGIPITFDDVAKVIDTLEDEHIRTQLLALPTHLVMAMLDVCNKVPAPSVKALVDAEMAARKAVVAVWFPKPKEGTDNKAELGQGWTLKYTHKIDRTVDEATVAATKDRLREEFKINPDTLFKVEHTLAIKEFRALENINEEAFKALQECLTVKPGSPKLEVIPPKEEE